MKAKKLPSGSWNCRVFSHYEYTPDGKKKRVYESFTVKDKSTRGKKECERLASDWAYRKNQRSENITVHDAIRKYIDLKEPVLSPPTIRAYETYLRNCYKPIADTSVRQLNQTAVQAWINVLSVGHSSKYVSNAYSLFASAVDLAGGERFRITLPARIRPELHTPYDEEVRKLLEYCDKKYELRTAIMLSAFGSLRRSEICAVTKKDIVGDTIRINKSMVIDKYNCWVTKRTPKNDTSNRVVSFPHFVIEQIDTSRPGDRIVPINPGELSNRFRRAMASSGLPESFRLHDLRHYYVSIAHAIGIPDQYVMRMGGWKTEHVMKRVYRDTLSDRLQDDRDKLNTHFRDAFCDA